MSDELRKRVEEILTEFLTSDEADIIREYIAERKAKLVEALRFYAVISDYKAPYTGGMGKLYFDCGLTARNALTELGLSQPDKETE